MSTPKVHPSGSDDVVAHGDARIVVVSSTKSSEAIIDADGGKEPGEPAAEDEVGADATSAGSKEGEDASEAKEEPAPLAGRPPSATESKGGSGSNVLKSRMKIRRNTLMTVKNPGGDIKSWSFDMWKCDPQELLRYVKFMFDSYHLLEEFGVSDEVFFAFAKSVRANYHEEVPYHNFNHAFDTLQAVWLLTNSSDEHQLLKHFTSPELLGLFVGAICHDVDHPGLNNQYQINSRSELAQLYNDVSVLENHHAAKTFKILGDAKADIFASLESAARKKMRSLIIYLILGTDMAAHFMMVDHFEKFLLQDGAALDPDSEEPMSNNGKKLILRVLMHTADISNVCRPGDTSMVWSSRLNEEFQRQGDTEKANRLPVNESGHRGADASARASMTLNFIDFFVAPLIVMVQRLLPTLRDPVDNMLENREAAVDMVLNVNKLSKGRRNSQEADAPDSLQAFVKQQKEQEEKQKKKGSAPARGELKIVIKPGAESKRDSPAGSIKFSAREGSLEFGEKSPMSPTKKPSSSGGGNADYGGHRASVDISAGGYTIGSSGAKYAEGE